MRVERAMVAKVLAVVKDLKVGRQGAQCADRRQRVSDVLGLVRVAEKRQIAGLNLYDAAIHCLGKLNACDRAEQVFKCMVVQPGRKTFSNLAVAFFNAGRTADAERFTQDMLREGFPLTADIVSLRLGVCSKRRDFEGCKRELQFLKDNQASLRCKILPRYVLQAALAARSHSDLTSFLEDHRHIIPASDPRIANLHLTLACARRDMPMASQIYHEHRDLKHSLPSVYTLYAKLCRRMGDYAAALAVWDAVKEDGVLCDLVLCATFMKTGLMAMKATSAEDIVERKRLRVMCEDVFSRAPLQYDAAWLLLMEVYATQPHAKAAHRLRDLVMQKQPLLGQNLELRHHFETATKVPWPAPQRDAFKRIGRLMPDTAQLFPEYPTVVSVDS